MAKVLQHRRDTTSNLSSVSGAVGEFFMDTTKNTLVVMDGSTNGGHPLALESDLVSDLNGLTDVTLTSPTPGQILKYNGSVWVNDTSSGGGADGATGPQGATGLDGATGLQGAQGASGIYSGLTVTNVTSLPGSPDANTLYIVTSS